MTANASRRLTKRTVDALRAVGRDSFVWDRDLPGFGVRLYATGRKVYVAQSRGPGGSKRVSLGRHGELTPKEARKQAARVIRRIKRGEDPVPVPSPPPATVADLAERYLRAHVAPNCKPRTAESYRSVIANHILPAMGGMAVGEVRRTHVVALHRQLRDRPAQANHTLRVLSQMFNRAAAWGIAPQTQNPCRDIGKYPLRPRQRYLTKAEYRRLGEVLKDAEAKGWLAASAVAAIRLLILTGCRRNEILSLRWDDVDRAARELRLRDTKTGPRMVALTPAVGRVLDGVQCTPGNPWVIGGKRPGTRRKTLTPAWKRVRARAGIDDVRLHDLRHSYASRALAVGESLSMIGRLLNHARMQTTARYAHLMHDAEKAAAARVGDDIAAHAAGNR